MNKYHSAMEKIVVTHEMEDRILRNLSSKKKPIIQLKKYLNVKWIMYAGTAAACCVIGICVIFSYPLLTNSNDGVQQSSVRSSYICTNPQKNQSKVSKPTFTAPVRTSKSEMPSHFYKSEAANRSKRSSTQSTVNPVRPSSHPKRPHVNESKPNKNYGKTDSSSMVESVSSVNPIVNTSCIDELKKIVPFSLSVPGKIPDTYRISSTSLISGEIAQIIYSDGNNSIIYREALESTDINCCHESYDETDTVAVGNVQVIFKESNSLINLATWTDNDCNFSLSFSAGMEEENVITIIESMKSA